MAGPHPYKNAADYRLWRRAIGETSAAEVDPVTPLPFRISREDNVVTAGSCFAQHISRRLKDNGFKFFVTERAHRILPPPVVDAFQYGLFSARYGNIYTARQLLQLFQRAYGRFQPRDDIWEEGGRFYDPFRPLIQPEGFATRDEYERDRSQHFAAVRRAFEKMNVFVFTLGLTECWVSRGDGAAYPVCPGTAAGSFDATRHAYVNFSVDEVVADMKAFFEELRKINPRVKTILTVSPVPLAATAEDRHVLVSTTYSKSVLRVAAEMLTRDQPNVAYFPSYEIVTGAYSRGAYFAPDLRNVTETGVDHVMRLFFKHAVEEGFAPGETPAAVEQPDDLLEKTQAYLEVQCEEERLDPGLRKLAKPRA